MHLRVFARHRSVLWLTGVDAITMNTSDGGTWSWSCAKDCPSTREECSVAVPIIALRNFTEVAGPLPSGLAMLSCKGRITQMYRARVLLASQSPPPSTCVSEEGSRRDWCAVPWRITP